MPLTRAKKAEQIDKLAKELKGSTTAIVGTFAKLTVSQDFQLRKAVRQAGGNYRVLKNKLAARASQGSGVEAALQGLKGVSSVAYTSGDPIALAKALSTWVKDNSEFTFKLGIVDGKVLTVAQISELATMPGKEEIYAKLLFLINSPAQRLVTVLSAVGRDLAVVINQGVEKGKFAAPAAVAAEPAASVPEAAATPAVVEAINEPAVSAAAPEAVATATDVPATDTPAAEAPVAVGQSEAPVVPEVDTAAIDAVASDPAVSAPEVPAADGVVEAIDEPGVSAATPEEPAV
jgi:large subunit ribosomal protein L10